MAKPIFTAVQHKLAEKRFKEKIAPADVAAELNERYDAAFTTQQLASLRSKLGLGPRQLAGVKVKQPKRKGKRRKGNGCHVTVTIPGGKLEKDVDRHIALAVMQLLVEE